MKRVLKILGTLIALVVICFGALLAFLSITEYKPENIEMLQVSGEASGTLKTGEEVRVLSWNLGYGALGDNADFFMDGGKGVTTADTPRVMENMTSIMKTVQELDPDLMLFQETDRRSARSHLIDETALLAEQFPGMQYDFANNFKVAFLPYPIPPIGKVDSGIMTMSSYPVREAQRLKLPCPFSWPIRMANLKRCLAVHRIPVDGTDRELVLVNLHLEAYDEGDGKAAQTRMLKDVLEKELEDGNYVIAGGDFNQTFSNVDISAYPAQEGKWASGMIEEEEFGEHWNLLMDPKVPTCRSLDQPYAGANQETFQYYVIDGFIVSDNIEVVSLETLDEGFTATDHNPVLLSFKLN